MKKIILAMLLMPLTVTAQTLEECQRAAENNYPLIRQYDLIRQTTDLTVSNVSKGWLPQVTATAQVTYQSKVVQWPDRVQQMYGQMGLDMKGLSKDQYKVGIDVQQTVYDGGAISSQKRIARQQGKVQEAQTEVTMYQVRQRVNEMYFALLLTDEQITMNRDLQQLLSANENKLKSMYEHGTAAESDYSMVRAERLGVMQQAVTLQSQRQALQRMLSAFCGIEVKSISKPAKVSMGTTGYRPELQLADAQLQLANAQERSLNAALMPKLSVFASGYYGYPGYNMFEDMMNRQWSWNGMVGARLSWNIGALYTRKNDKGKLRVQRDMAETTRSVFLFNNNLEQIQQKENILRYEQLMADDEEIITLRTMVRRAAESKLSNGIIDVNDLIREINSENAAKVQQSMHEIEMLKEMYDWKITTNS